MIFVYLPMWIGHASHLIDWPLVMDLPPSCHGWSRQGTGQQNHTPIPILEAQSYSAVAENPCFLQKSISTWLNWSKFQTPKTRDVGGRWIWTLLDFQVSHLKKKQTYRCPADVLRGASENDRVDGGGVEALALEPQEIRWNLAFEASGSHPNQKNGKHQKRLVREIIPFYGRKIQVSELL